jgi:hypothetical protein
MKMNLDFLSREWIRLILSVVVLSASIATTARAQQPSLAHYDVYVDGETIHLLTGYGRKGDPAIALWHRRSSDGGATWTTPIRVNTDADRLSAHHPGENPQLAARGDRIVVAWTAPPAGARRGGPIGLSISDDGGKTWKAGAPSFPDTTGAQTFMELTFGSSGLHMVWLERRDRTQSLRYAASPDGGFTWGAPRPLAPSTCDCCWNSLAVSPEGEIATLYRGEQPRDMMLVTSKNGTAWRQTGSIGGFGWNLRGCPHVGGGLVHSGKALHTLVWTGKDDIAGLYYLSSTDSGSSWSKPLRMGAQDAKNPDLARSTDGTLVAVWDEPRTLGSSIQMARSTDNGMTWSAAERVAEHKDATLPRVAATSKGTAVFWMEGSPWRGGALKVNGREVGVP